MDSLTESSNLKKTMSTGLSINMPHDIKTAINLAMELGYYYIVTQVCHPNYARDLIKGPKPNIGRTDRVLQSHEWCRLIVGELTPSINVDSEIESVALQSKAMLIQELEFSLHLGLPIIKFDLNKRHNPNLAQVINSKLMSSSSRHFSLWVTIPMTHPSQYSPICSDDEKEDTWEWWNEFRTFCNYDKHLGLALELPSVEHIPNSYIIDRWVGEPVQALIIPTSLFLINSYGRYVLSKLHQELIQKFMIIDVQYIIKSDKDDDLSVYPKYLDFLGKKLYVNNPTIEFAKGIEDNLLTPLQPLSEHLETNIYEVFERDNIKYTTYQKAIEKALRQLSNDVDVPVLIVVGAGRGPLVQAALNASYLLNKKIKMYAIEKNPFAFNTLIDRNEHEWNKQVILFNEDMRYCNPPDKADILISELLGSFGDNELSPECLDGAQRFLKPKGISIPSSYTSYLAPIQSLKVFNEIRYNKFYDKSITYGFERPYIIRLVNYFQIAKPLPLFTYIHPNWNVCNNDRFKKLNFSCTTNCILTGFVGFFHCILYDNITISIHPDYHTKEMISWFPIVFSLQQPLHVKTNERIDILFWRLSNSEKVWYEWCLESPIKQPICNPGGRTFFIKKLS